MHVDHLDIRAWEHLNVFEAFSRVARAGFDHDRVEDELRRLTGDQVRMLENLIARAGEVLED